MTRGGEVYVADIETTGLERDSDFIVGVINNEVYWKDRDGFTDRINEIFENNLGYIVGHNLFCFDLCNLCYHLPHCLPSVERHLDKVIDTLLISKLLYPGRLKHSLESWGNAVGVKKVEVSNDEFVQGSDRTLLEKRCLKDVELNRALLDKFESRRWKHLVGKQYSAHQKFCGSIVVPMMCTGLPFHEATAKDKEIRLAKKRARNVMAARKVLGDINFQSNQQIDKALKDVYGKGLPLGEPAKKTGRRSPILNKDNREEMIQKFPILANVFLAKDAKMHMDFFGEGKKSFRYSLIGDRVFYHYNHIGARTFRSAISAPPMQQVPKDVRAAIKAVRGQKILAADVDSLEYAFYCWLLKNVLKSPKLWDALQAGVSPKKQTIEVFKKHGCLDRVVLYGGQTLEDKCKTATYAKLYGAADATLAAQFNVPHGEFHRMTAAVEERFMGIKLLSRAIENAIVDGCITNVWGEKVPTTPYKALNTFIQSSGSGYSWRLLYLFYTNLKKEFDRLGRYIRPICWVHDEIVMEMEHFEGHVEVIEAARLKALDEFEERWGFPCIAGFGYNVNEHWTK